MFCQVRVGITFDRNWWWFRLDPPKWENMSNLSKCLQNQDAPENTENYQMKAHLLLSSVVYNIVSFYVLFIVHAHFFLRLIKTTKNVHPLVYKANPLMFACTQYILHYTLYRIFFHITQSHMNFSGERNWLYR